MITTSARISRCLVTVLVFRSLMQVTVCVQTNANLVAAADLSSNHGQWASDTQAHSGTKLASGISNRSSARQLLSVDVSASSTASGAHSASGNLSTAASYRPGPYAAAVGVALVDGTAAVDRGNASVSTQDGSEIKGGAALIASKSIGSGRNASASQGLTAVTSTTNHTANSELIQNSAASGSSAADVSSSSVAKSQTGNSADRQSSDSSTTGDESASGKPANAVSDSSEVSDAAAPGKVTASQATNATANHSSKYVASDVTADKTATSVGYADVSSAPLRSTVTGSSQAGGSQHAEVDIADQSNGHALSSIG